MILTRAIVFDATLKNNDECAMHDSNFVVKLQNVFRMVYLLQFYVLILYFFELGYRSHASVVLKIINFAWQGENF